MSKENEASQTEEPQGATVSDLITHAIDTKPLDFQSSFADLMQQNIADAVYDAKLSIAAGYLGNTELDDDGWDNEDGQHADDEQEYGEEEEDYGDAEEPEDA